MADPLPRLVNILQVESETPTVLAETVRSAAAGTVVQIYHQVGDQVTRGTLLAALDSDAQKYQMDLTRAQLDALGSLKTAEAQLQQRQADLGQMQDLLRKHQASQYQVESAQALVQYAEGQLKSIQEQRKNLAIQNAYWTDQYNKRFLLSPVDGYIADAKITIGQSVGIAAEAFLIKNPNAVTFTVSVPSAIAGALHVDQHLAAIAPGVKGSSNVTVNDILSDPASDGSRRLVKFVVYGVRPAGQTLSKFTVFFPHAAPDTTLPPGTIPSSFPSPTDSPARVK